MKDLLKLGVAVGAFLPVLVFAVHPSIKVTNLSYAGSGCPSGSVSVIMTPNKGAINAVFDHFFSAFEDRPDHKVKRCKFAMNVSIPNNKRVRLRQVRLRGFVDLPVNSNAKIVRSYRFDGATKRLTSTWKGKAFRVINRREPFNTTWSKCGKDVRLEVDSMMELKSRATSLSQIGIDSFDHLMTRDYRGERGWKFILDYMPC